MKTSSHHLKAVAAIVALAGAAAVSGQTPVSVLNAGFESPVLTEGEFSAAADDWSAVGDADIGAWNVQDADFPAGAPEGANVAYVYNAAAEAGISQVLAGASGQFRAGANYTLSVKVGNSITYPWAGYRVQLLAGGTVLAEDDDSLDPAAGEFLQATVSYSYDDALHGGLVGQPLEIRLLSKALAQSTEVEFDDVQLGAVLTGAVADPGGPYKVGIGGSLALDGGNSLPADGETITTWEWDLDNDGTFGDVTGVTPDPISDSELQATYGMIYGDNPIALRVTDSGANTSTSPGIVKLAPPIGGQCGVLDLDNANGGINPATGEPWAVGDRYRLGFTTSTTRTADSTDIRDYNDFVQGVAAGSTAFPKLGYGCWKVIGSTGAVSARQNTGTDDTTPGVGEPLFLLDGATLLTVDNADLWNGFPLRYPAAESPNGQNMFYSPYLDEEGVEDESGTFGPNVATGTLENGNSEGEGGRVLGGSNEVPPKITHGNTRANTAGRIIRRFNGSPSSEWKFYAISDPLTVVDLTDDTAPSFVSIEDDVAGGPVSFPNGVVYTVTFDEPMAAGTVRADDFENAAATAISIEGVNATADPAVFEVAVLPVSAGTIQLQIKAGAELLDLVGNPLDTTAAIPDDTVIAVEDDTVPPVVDTVSPDGTVGEPLTPTLVITFIEESEIVLGAGNIELRNAADDSLLLSYAVTDPEVSLSGPLEATITPSSQLPFGTSVYVNIDEGAFEDLSGNAFAGIADKTTWAFTTVALPAADGPLSVFIAGTAGETVPFDTDPAGLVHSFDTFPRLSADHLPANASDIQLSAGHHLVLYSSRFDSTGGSNRSEIQSNLNLDGVDLAAGWSQGYIRRQETQDETITAGGAIVDAASAGQILQLQSFRTDNNTGERAERAAGNTAIQLLKLDDGWDYLSLAGHDGTGDDQVIPQDNVTWTPVEYQLETEVDAGSFAYLAGTGVTLVRSGHYLVFANTHVTDAAERSALIQRLTLDGAEVDGSMTNVYLRGGGQNGCEDGAAAVGMIIETTAPGQVLNVEVRQSDADGTLTVVGTQTGLTMVKLPDSAEFVRLVDASGDQDVNATGVLLYDDPGSQLELDSAFSHSIDTDPSRVGVTRAGDYLFLASFFVPDGNASRGFPNLGWQVNGAGGLSANGQTGRYSRDTGPQELGNWCGFMSGLAGADFVETLTGPLGNGGDCLASVVALQGVSVDSLFGVAPSNPYDDWAAGVAGLADPDPDLDFDGGGLETGIEWVVAGDPTDASDDSELGPTYDTTTDPDFLVFTYRRSDLANADANTGIAVEYGSDLVGWTTAVNDGTDIIITETDDGAAAGVDLVEVKINRSLAVEGKLFARLKVTVVMP